VEKATALEIQTAGQKYLGNTGLIIFIVLMNMFVPLSIDLYLPALPGLKDYFGSGTALTNMTLSIFMFFYAIGILLWGPISDKYGRRPVIALGSLIYIASSISCSLAPNIYLLIAARAMQGVGGGAIISSSFAIVKDCYTGKKREKILAVTQSISGIAPMVAPVLGAWILKFTDWRGAFWILAAVGIFNFLLTVLYQDTLRDDEKYIGSLLGSLSRLYVVGKNKSFTIPNLIFSVSQLPFMGYIAVSSYIYVNHFGLSEQAYSYFFAANSCITILGPIIYVRFFINHDKKALAMGSFVIAAISGILVMTIGGLSPYIFLVCIVAMSMTGAVMRPFSINVLFEQQKGDTGTASSLFNTVSTLFGILGMTIASFDWGNIIVSLGAIITAASVLSSISWYAFIKSPIPCKGVKNA
jgi:DHA1 family bicyclomycin/chloramphenicol resistance-like MFS transporter